MMRPLQVRLMLLAMAATACGGPAADIDFGGKAVPINVAFGAVERAPKASGPAPVLQPGPGGIGVVSVLPGLSGLSDPSRPNAAGGSPVVPSGPTPAAPVAAACPAQRPFAFPRNEATNLVQRAVPEGTYPYRISGTSTVNDKKTNYATTLQQTVKRLSADPAGRRRFATSFSLLGLPYTITYAITTPVEGPAQTAPGEIGLASIVQDTPDDSGPSFRPVEPLRLLQLRAEKGVKWSEATNDPLSATTATVEGLIADKVRVNACGQPVEAWKSVVTERIVTPGQNITATRTLFFATGLGGLLVAEQVSFDGTARGARVSGSSTMTINVDPGAP